MSSQCIPCPLPISLQCLRSCEVAWRSLGNHASGTEIVLPSLRSTVRVSFVTVTRSAFGTSSSTSEIVIPHLHEPGMMLFDNFLDFVYFNPAEAAAIMHPDRFKPELCNFIIALHMHMPWLVFI